MHPSFLSTPLKGASSRKLIINGVFVEPEEMSLKLLRGLVWCSAFVCGSFLPARAQIAIYAQATGASLRFDNTAHMYGATFGAFRTKPVGPLALGADFRGVMVKGGGTQGSNNDQKLDEGQFGFRAAAAPHVLPFSLSPYAEALVGLGYWRGGSGVFRQDRTHALMQIVVGADVPVYRSLEWRIAEFSYARAGAQPGFINPITVSTGFVIRLPNPTSSKH